MGELKVLYIYINVRFILVGNGSDRENLPNSVVEALQFLKRLFLSVHRGHCARRRAVDGAEEGDVLARRSVEAGRRARRSLGGHSLKNCCLERPRKTVWKRKQAHFEFSRRSSFTDYSTVCACRFTARRARTLLCLGTTAATTDTAK